MRLKFLHSYEDRHGKRRHYVRLPGRPAVAITWPKGTKKFLDAYRQILADAGIKDPVAAQRGARSGHIYFISDGEHIKIGFAVNVKTRLSSLQVGNKKPLTLLGSFPGTLASEQALHKAFSHLHVGGEWFRNDRALADRIALCADTVWLTQNAEVANLTVSN